MSTAWPETNLNIGEMHSGQVRMAYRLAAEYQGKLLYVHGIGWHHWDDTRWAEDHDGTTKRAVLDTLRKAMHESVTLDGGDKRLRKDAERCESATGVAGVLNIASALEPFARTVESLDADPYLLNTATGTLDLRTMELRPPDPADLLTKVTTAGYRPESRSEEWDKFLEHVLPDEQVRGFLQRLIGLSLLGKVREHVFPIAIGVGRNGKGTAYTAVLNALGDYGHVAESDLFMSARSNPNGASPALVRLRGRRFIVVSETERDHRLAVALMKNLTGGDPITARALHRDPITFDPSHTPLMVTNHLPKVAGDDPAAWRRIRVIPFHVTIPEGQEDNDLPERLELAVDAVLAWAVRGWQEYNDRGLDSPEAVTAATEDYRKDSDAVARFIETECMENPHMWASMADLWERWSKWRTEEGAEEISKRAFGEALDARGYTSKRGKGGMRIRQGIGLQGGDDEPVQEGLGDAW